jgi:hypothetical protein
MENKQNRLVGAPRFELGTSCAQGRRATRLRYAPTVIALFILKHFPTLLLIRVVIFGLWHLRVERKHIPHLRVMGRNIRFLKSDPNPALRIVPSLENSLNEVH